MDHLHTWIPAYDLGMGRYRCADCAQTGYRTRRGIRAHKKPPKYPPRKEATVRLTGGKKPDLDWYDWNDR